MAPEAVPRLKDDRGGGDTERNGRVHPRDDEGNEGEGREDRRGADEEHDQKGPSADSARVPMR